MVILWFSKGFPGTASFHFIFYGIIWKCQINTHNLIHCINDCRVQQKVFEHLAYGLMFRQLLQDLANEMHAKMYKRL